MTEDAELPAEIMPALKIDGWLSPNEAALLYGLARHADGPIVEIGSWQGRSTAALGLGSMAGRQQPVYAVDSFCGPQMAARATSLNNNPAGVACSPERLRANLDAAGVNGLVRIVPKASQDALQDVPEEIGLLFVDGCHDYEAVCRDIDLYAPRLKVGGIAVFHDVTSVDPGVVRAMDDRIMSQPLKWRSLDRVDSALVVRRVETTRRVIGLACPGGSFSWGVVSRGIVQSTLGAHRVDLDNNGNGFDDFNALWARSLDRAEAGEIDYFAMLHSDVIPCPGWVDLLVDEIEATKADLVSVACSIKDERFVCNSGIGDLSNPWGAFRRFTVREILKMPPTFGLKNTPYKDDPTKYLLHNTGCWIADLKRPVFTETDDDGNLKAWFNFPTRIRRDAKTKRWSAGRESEDWFFSRMLHGLGAKTLLTRKIRLGHEGKAIYRNDEAKGWTCDHDTAPVWDESKKKETAA